MSLTPPGSFVLGANYWASHAGTRTWSDWQPRGVAADLRRLARAGLQVLRVFPLWPDFQPLHLLRTGGGPVEMRFGEAEEPLPDTEAGRAGVCETMIGRFDEFTRLAERFNLRLIVGLITGWMSGRLFVPPAFDGRNVLTDPLAIQWQVRFVKYFVRRFRACRAIAAWDLGNECNCMAFDGVTRAHAWTWTAAIVNAIRSEDASRPVVSGMHSLLNVGSMWTPADQGELTDLLTTHPYPIFTPHCDQDPINTIRTLLHATAESRAYGDIGGKGCLCEEIGTIAPMVCSERVAADYIRTNLFSLWAHDCHGLLWWCAADQDHLAHAPYDWCACERELGLFRQNGKGKPVLAAMTKFRRFLDGLPARVRRLPARVTDAVCILSADQDQWAAAFSSFVLAKQAGLDIEFQQHDQPIRDAQVYLLPSICGTRVLSRRRWLELLDRVHAGATLYISCEDGLLSPCSEQFGVEFQTRQRRIRRVEAIFDGLTDQPTLTVGGPFSLTLRATSADVLALEPGGNPVFTRNAWGKGQIFFLAFPVESQLTRTVEAFHGPNALPYWRIYQRVAASVKSRRVVTKESPAIGLTEHPLGAKARVAVAINYSPEPTDAVLRLARGWSITQRFAGRSTQESAAGEIICPIPANDAVVLVINHR